MSKSEQKRIRYQETGTFQTAIDKAAQGVCAYLRNQISHAAEIDADEEEIVAAIIKRELEKAVPVKEVMQPCHVVDCGCRNQGHNECRTKIGLGE